MPIPLLTSHGLLPVGIHDVTLTEVRERFGVFQGSDHRQRLFMRLAELVAAMQRSGLFEALLIDGSFVTAKIAPNDVDVIAVLRLGHDFERDLPMSEYALVSRTMLARRFRFDIVVVERSSAVYKTYVEFFSRERQSPELRKGILRVTL